MEGKDLDEKFSYGTVRDKRSSQALFFFYQPEGEEVLFFPLREVPRRDSHSSSKLSQKLLLYFRPIVLCRAPAILHVIRAWHRLCFVPGYLFKEV